MKFSNALIHESSPYLLQHAHNPVNWHPWNETTLQKAEREQKMIIVSIGYSACHWCHVMERESFEDEEVAALMNNHFINIKVDREERPDIDQIYMDAVQLISGRGGWPLNAICLPDTRPVYAGTYFSKHQWMQVLKYFIYEYQHHRNNMYEQAENLTYHISLLGIESSAPGISFTATDNDAVASALLAEQDPEYGGRYGAPKFPMPVNYLFLLQHHFFSRNDKVLKAITTVLDKMLMGGIYDQIGGGFARYSVDDHWEIPHFEKMLYDNAQLVSLYAQAFQLTKDLAYQRIVYETLDFIKRELTGSEGNFFSALDADSQGEEGKFYVWDYEELKRILSADFDGFQKVYRLLKEGNFEGKIHLTRLHKESNNELAEQLWKTKLLDERNKRPRPGLDDKTITAWNALMLKGYVDAYVAFGNESYLETALKNGYFILSHQWAADKRLLRSYKNGKSSIPGFLDDYAFSIEAFLSLFEVTFDEQWLQYSLEMTEYCLENFFDSVKKVFYYTDRTSEKLIARKAETSDNVIPASNSVMAKNLYKIGLLTEKEHYRTTAETMALKMKNSILRHPSFYANWAILMRWITDEPYVISILSDQPKNIRLLFGQHYLPAAFFISGRSQIIPSLKEKLSPASGQNVIYVCRNRSCGLPAHNVDEALKQIFG